MEKVERFLRPDDVFYRVGFSDTTIREMEKVGAFPKAILIGTGKVKRRVWRESEITAWMEDRTSERDRQQPEPMAA